MLSDEAICVLLFFTFIRQLLFVQKTCSPAFKVSVPSKSCVRTPVVQWSKLFQPNKNREVCGVKIFRFVTTRKKDVEGVLQSPHKSWDFGYIYCISIETFFDRFPSRLTKLVYHRIGPSFSIPEHGVTCKISSLNSSNSSVSALRALFETDIA